jgi:hypothetical protein
MGRPRGRSQSELSCATANTQFKFMLDMENIFDLFLVGISLYNFYFQKTKNPKQFFKFEHQNVKCFASFEFLVSVHTTLGHVHIYVVMYTKLIQF